MSATKEIREVLAKLDLEPTKDTIDVLASMLTDACHVIDDLEKRLKRLEVNGWRATAT